MTSTFTLHSPLTQRNYLYKYTLLQTKPKTKVRIRFTGTCSTMEPNQTQTSALTLLSLMVVLCVFSQASAQAPAPGPSGATEDCFNSLLSMSDCLTFVEMGSNVTKPDKMCCPALAGLVNSNPICLCQLLGNTSAIGIPIDVNKALTLPTVCNVTTPSVSLCAAIGIPVGAPRAMDMPGSPPFSEGLGPMITPDIAPPGSAGSRSIGEFSQVIIVALSSTVVAILF